MQIRASLLALALLACVLAAQPATTAARAKPKQSHGKKAKQKQQKKQKKQKRAPKKRKATDRRAYRVGVAGSWERVIEAGVVQQGAPGDTEVTTTDRVDWEASGRATVRRTGRGYLDARLVTSTLDGEVGNLSQHVDYLGYRFDPFQRAWVACPATYDERLQQPLKLHGSLLYQAIDDLEPNFAEPVGPIERSQSQPELCNVFPPLGPQQSRVVRQEQMAAIPPEPEMECTTGGSWETGWHRECHATFNRPRTPPPGEIRENWTWALSIKPIRNAS